MSQGYLPFTDGDWNGGEYSEIVPWVRSRRAITAWPSVSVLVIMSGVFKMRLRWGQQRKTGRQAIILTSCPTFRTLWLLHAGITEKTKLLPGEAAD